jgi:hypothetical protein
LRTLRNGCALWCGASDTTALSKHKFKLRLKELNVLRFMERPRTGHGQTIKWWYALGTTMGVPGRTRGVPSSCGTRMERGWAYHQAVVRVLVRHAAASTVAALCALAGDWQGVLSPGRAISSSPERQCTVVIANRHVCMPMRSAIACSFRRAPPLTVDGGAQRTADRTVRQAVCYANRV